MKLLRGFAFISVVLMSSLVACSFQLPTVPQASTATNASTALTSPLPSPVGTTASAPSTKTPATKLQGTLVYHSDNDRKLFQIFSAALGNDNPEIKQLTADLDRTIEPRWSPDGSHLIYTSAKENHDGLDLWLMNADGSEQKRLTERPGYALSPVFNREGTQVLFYTTWDGKFQLYRLNIATKALTRLSTNASYNDYMPDISPDGKTIAFSSDRSGREEIWLMDADGNNQRQITNAPMRNWRPRWSPDGARILYQQITQNFWELRLMNADGTQDSAPIPLPYVKDGFQITEIQDHYWIDNQSVLFAGNSPQHGYGIYYYNLVTHEMRTVLDLPTSDEMWPILRPQP
jgi:dipeptidyl aminopeptidase/acylaminoacyl peptidase